MLTIEQERFAQEYVATGNGCEAYRRAYDTNGKRNNVESYRENRSSSKPPSEIPIRTRTWCC